jgi:hypothetical protein
VPGPICTVEGGTVKGRRVEVVHAEMNRAAQHVNALVAILGPALAEGDSSGESHCQWPISSTCWWPTKVPTALLSN